MGMNISPATRQARNHATGVRSRNEPTEAAIGFPRPAWVLASVYTHAAAANMTLNTRMTVGPAAATSVGPNMYNPLPPGNTSVCRSYGFGAVSAAIVLTEPYIKYLTYR